MLRATDVLAILDSLSTQGVPVWLDGGWGVDALVGEQTREHDDIDVVLILGQVDAAGEVLGRLGFSLAIDDRPTRLVWRDRNGRQIDIHPVTFDANGTGWQRGASPDGGDCAYPADGFTIGAVDGRRVGCLTAALQIGHHQGYEPDEKDWHDMRLLHERFGVDLPSLFAEGTTETPE